ncbi:MAG: phosphate transport system regulatory protein PhoU [Bacilli bacterium]|nr:phosphate transport system regulatory protein PhoU [Bacilli bacterium]
MDTRRNLHAAIEELQQELTKMGQLVEEAIYESVKSLQDMDVKRAEKIINGDDFIDASTLQIEETCLRILALQQPMGVDLREVSTALKIVTDLERIADHGTDIAKITVRLAGETLAKPLIDIPKMAELARQMVRDALTAYVERNVALAQALAAQDDQVDKLFAQIFVEVIDMMGPNRDTNRQLTHLLMVARMLERVADHATNLGESVIYMVTGKREDLNA